jgi:FAD/FMN-containing dehydrogenase
MDFPPSQPLLVESYTGFVTTDMATKENLDRILDILSGWTDLFGSLVGADVELWGGAMADPAPQETSFVHRDVIFNVGVVVYVPTAMENAAEVFNNVTSTIASEWPNLSPYFSGAYSNYQMRTLSETVYPELYWGTNLDRLQRIKEEYDPTNIFTFRQAIPLP